MKRNRLIFIISFSSLYFLSAQPASTLDPGFNNEGFIQLQLDSNETAFKNVTLQPNGNILVTGYSLDSVGRPHNFLLRFLPDGSPDPDFATQGRFISPGWTLSGVSRVLPDNKILSVIDQGYSNQVIINRLYPNGLPDTLFGPNGQVFTTIPGVNNCHPKKMYLLPEGKFLVLADYTNPATGRLSGLLVRFLEDGQVDTGFGQFGVVKLRVTGVSDDVWVENFDIQPDGKIVVPGRIGNNVAETKWYIGRFLPDGTPDSGFGDGGVLVHDFGDQSWEGATDVSFIPDGRMVVAGYAYKYPTYCFTIIRVTADGVVDNTFGFGGKGQLAVTCCSSAPYEIERQDDGKFVLCGIGHDQTGKAFFSVGRFKANGAVDPGFASGGLALSLGDGTSQLAEAMLIQPDGKILVLGNTIDMDEYAVSGLIARFTGDAMVHTEMPVSGFDFSPELSPNPLESNELTLRYQLPKAAHVNLEIFDLLGRKVQTVLEKAPRSEGDHAENIQVKSSLTTGQFVLKIATEQGVQAIQFVRKN